MRALIFICLSTGCW